MIAVMVAVCSFLLASSSIPELAPYSIAMRVIGALVVIAPIVWRNRLSERAPFPRFSRTLIATGAGFSIYLMASTLAHGDALACIIGLLSFLLVASLVFALLNFYSTGQVVTGVYAALLVLCVGSLVAQRIVPDIAMENDRLRGVLENANELGFAAFAMGAISLAVRLVPWQSILGLGLALVCLSLSASRASMLALILVASGLAIGRVRRARLLVAFCVIAVGVVWLTAPGLFEPLPLLRTTDTRSFGFENMQRAMSESFWTGLGSDLPAEAKAAGSPFAAGIAGGMWGLVGLGLMYFGLIRGFAASRPRAFALVVAGIIHSMFESWMLSFSAPMLLAFFVLLVAFAQMDAKDEAEGGARDAGPVGQAMIGSGHGYPQGSAKGSQR